jgi:hypothetical protein
MGRVDAQQVVEGGGGINECCAGGITVSAFKPQTPGKYPKENILHKEHSESLKSRHLHLYAHRLSVTFFNLRRTQMVDAMNVHVGPRL